MKKKLLFILFILISTKNFGQIIVGFPEISEVEGWNGNSWVSSSKTTYTFNSNCLPILALGQFIFNGSLQNASLTTFTYISESQLIQEITQTWDADTATWINYLKTEHTYNGEILAQTTNYDWINNDWQLRDRTIFSSDSSGFTTGLIGQIWDNINGIWVNLIKSDILHDSENKETISINFNWNASTMLWENSTMSTTIYLNSIEVLSSATTNIWNNNQWEKAFLETYTYDANNYLIEYLTANWDTPSMSYINSTHFLYTNISGGYPTTTIAQSWNSSTNSWLNTARVRNTYPDCLTLSVSDFENVDVKIFPNPTIEKIFITTTTKANYTLSNINGQLIKKGTLIDGNNTISLSNLSKGLYFININTDEGSVTKKIIKQ